MKHTSAVAAKLRAMSVEEMQALAERLPVVVTIDGHALSLRNTLMLHMQSAVTPSVVGGFRQWLAAGRCVRKGEKALYILHPCARKAQGDEDQADVYFREAAVFDATQTDPLPVSAPAEPCEA
jgi:antirestriction protein ArdC